MVEGMHALGYLWGDGWTRAESMVSLQACQAFPLLDQQIPEILAVWLCVGVIVVANIWA